MGNAVLGGIEGVKWRLGLGKKQGCSYSLEQRIAALSEALNYGQAGIDLLLQALEHDSWHVHQATCSLLEKHAQTKVKQALQRYRSRLSQELLKCYEAGERNFHRANLSGIYLQWADLSGANLSGANLHDAELSQANLKGANLTHTYLKSANLSGANLREAILREADLRGADLRGADLSQVILTWANLREANLSQANLCGANLVGSKLTGADLSDANLCGAKLKSVNLSVANLRGAYYNNQTEFPIGFAAYSQLFEYIE